jgi:integrase/recombinase XerC/integrase/recombinase XerD
MNALISSASSGPDRSFLFDETILIKFMGSLDIRDSSKHTYARQLKEFFAWLHARSESELSRETILAYKDFLKNEKRLAAFTIAGYLTALRRFFEWLESIKIFPNVAKSIRGPKRHPGFKRDALTVNQVRRLLASIDRNKLDGLRDYALINLLVRTGLRTVEVVRAAREDIANNSGAKVLWVQGKGRDSKDELVLLTEKALEPIEIYWQALKNCKEGDPLFASHSTKNFGKSLTTRSVSRIVKNHLRAIGLNDRRLSAHSLRHTAITISMLAGATPQEARAMARHADINTTLIYAHNINRIMNAPEKKIDELLG